MKISEIMTSDVQVVQPNATIREAAQFMLRADAGVVPVCDGQKLQGMITDRDIAVRAVAEGLGPDTPVTQVMTGEILFAFEDDDVEDVASQMSQAQVRRMPIVSREDKKLVGIVSVGDLSDAGEHDVAALALDGITEDGGKHSQS
ncbi:MAG TPA: CBS domain-containing protein [Allosphingosinicella sp.]|jgi:CBS domain-containing protein|nr:CBS domain-containing protein [Allosphingosinicella sp.]